MTTEITNPNELMSYVITRAEGFEAGIQRIIDEQVKRAVTFLTEEEDVHKGVHDARRCLKITRAAWRLIREDLDPGDFKHKNAFYRDAGRCLSELRDLTALLETLDMLEKRNKRVKNWVSNRVFRQVLEEKRQDMNGAREEELPLQVARHLATRYEEVNECQLSKKYGKNVLSSLRKVYTRGHQAFVDCAREPEPERMHEWRKRCKYLRYHFHMLRESWPALFNTVENEFHLLTDYLGDFNNLTVMQRHLQDPEYALKFIHRKQLLQEAERCQQELWQSSIELGALLFAESPKIFENRMDSYLKWL